MLVSPTLCSSTVSVGQKTTDEGKKAATTTDERSASARPFNGTTWRESTDSTLTTWHYAYCTNVTKFVTWHYTNVTRLRRDLREITTLVLDSLCATTFVGTSRTKNADIKGLGGTQFILRATTHGMLIILKGEPLYARGSPLLWPTSWRAILCTKAKLTFIVVWRGEHKVQWSLL